MDTWTIGARLTNGGVLSRFFTGDLDDIRIYNEALTITQIKELWNNGVRSWNDQISPILFPRINMSGGMQE